VPESGEVMLIDGSVTTPTAWNVRFDAAIERWKVSMAQTDKEKNAEWFQGIVDGYKSERRREYRNSAKQDH
jgi:hypothetical protein